MDIKIIKLKPEHSDDYLRFFDTEDHSDNIAEHKCYCVCWCSDDHRNGAEKMSTAKKRRTLAKEYVATGMIQGYLAYMGNRVVGWCNANNKKLCMNCISGIRLLRNAPKSNETENIKSIFCFAIAPDMRRKGIATKLLKHACDEAKNEGYTFIEAYPNKKMKGLDDFEGPLAMYRKCGFYIYDELEDKYIMRKNI